jgi:hypothetical protein
MAFFRLMSTGQYLMGPSILSAVTWPRQVVQDPNDSTARRLRPKGVRVPHSSWPPQTAKMLRLRLIPAPTISGYRTYPKTTQSSILTITGQTAKFTVTGPSECSTYLLATVASEPGLALHPL